MRADAREDAELVAAARTDDPAAFGVLVERWLDRCWEVAWRILHDRELAAEVAQETLFTAWRRLDGLDQPASFGGWVLRISRNRALDRLQRERRTMSTGDEGFLEAAAGDDRSGSPGATVERDERRDLVWAAAAALGERDSSLLDLHLRHGLEPAELATELGISANAAHQALFRLRTRMGDAIRAWLLWRAGTPRCVVLGAELAAAGRGTFDAQMVRAVLRHADGCLACDEERSRVTAPAALFAAVPLVLAPTLARAQVLDGLLAAGVPIGAATSGAASGDVSATEADRAPGAESDGEGSDGDEADVSGASGAPGAEGVRAEGVRGEGVRDEDDRDEDDDPAGIAWWVVAALVLLIALGTTTVQLWPDAAQVAAQGPTDTVAPERLGDPEPPEEPGVAPPQVGAADPSSSGRIDGLTPDVDLPRGAPTPPRPALAD